VNASGLAVFGLVAVSITACGGNQRSGSPAGRAPASTVPPGLIQAARAAHVTDLRRVGPIGPADLGFFSGNDQSGQAVVAIASDNEVSPFVPQQHLADYLASNKLYVHSADSGSGPSVASRDAHWRKLPTPH